MRVQQALCYLDGIVAPTLYLSAGMHYCCFMNDSILTVHDIVNDSSMTEKGFPINSEREMEDRMKVLKDKVRKLSNFTLV